MNVLKVDYVSIRSWQDTIRFAGLSYDPNFYTILSVVSLVLLVFYISFILKNNLFKLLLIFATLFMGLITFSKSVLICYSLVIIFSISLSRIKLNKSLLLTVFLGLGILVFFRDQIYFIINIILSRFKDYDDLNSISTGRVTLWKEYCYEIFNSFTGSIFGYGLHGKLLSRASHNTYLEIIYKFGLIGFIVNIMYFFSCMFYIPKSKKYYLKDWVFVILIIALLFNLSAYSFYSLWACLFIMIVYIRDGECKNETINYSSNI